MPCSSHDPNKGTEGAAEEDISKPRRQQKEKRTERNQRKRERVL
jgi:hypothetical protein